MLIVLLLSACSDKKETTTGIDITNAADTWRYNTPEGMLQNVDLSQNVEIQLANRFPVWRESIGAAVDISIKNISKLYFKFLVIILEH